jgi:AefR-like transcriptional repressor, C-terminal domain
MRNVAEVIDSEIDRPDGVHVEERLVKLGVAMLRSALTDDHIGVTRLGISEARHFPNLADQAHRMANECGIAAVTRLLSEAAHSDKIGALAAFGPSSLAATAQFFIDLVLWPMLRHALFGEKLRSLRAGIEAHVAQSVVFFLAACRAGGAASSV